jgi:cation diffusion facilitator family transporter
VVLNVSLAALKMLAGIFGASQALVADAVHSVSDTVTDATILVGVRFWSAPPDENHPHGHGRIETAITVGIGAALAVVATGLVLHAIEDLQNPASTHSPGWITFFAALVSIGSKEAIYRWTAIVGKRIKSSAVLANAWHHRSDALSSIPAAIAVLGARIHPQWHFLDPIGAIVVSVFIIHAAGVIALPALGQLVDVAASRLDREKIETIALETEGVQEIHAVRTRHVGSGLQVDLHILVDGDMSVRQGHKIAGAVKHRLLDEGPEVIDVVVHLEPNDKDIRLRRD